MSVFATASGTGSWPGTAARSAAEVVVGELGAAMAHVVELPGRGVGADIVGRAGALLVDVASAYLQWGKPEQAYEVLCAAERFAPQELSGRPAVRQLILDTWIAAPASISRRAEELARRTGVAG